MHVPQEASPVRASWTLSDVSEAVQRHYREYPDHGAGCACLEPLITLGVRMIRPADLGASDRTRDAVRHTFAEMARRV